MAPSIHKHKPWFGSEVTVNSSWSLSCIFFLPIDGIEEKNPKNSYGQTPLHYAALGGHVQAFLIIFNMVEDKNPKDSPKQTPLHIAAEKGYEEIVQIIIGKSKLVWLVTSY